MGSKFTGPLLNAEKSAGAREFFNFLPISEEPDYVTFYSDFIFSKDYAAADWTVTETQAGATQALVADALNGEFALVNSAADDDVNQIQSAEEWFKMSSGKRAWFETKVKVSDATQSDFFVGFCTTDTTVIAGTTDSVGFRKLDGSTTVSCLTEDATSETTSTAYTAANDTYATVQSAAA